MVAQPVEAEEMKMEEEAEEGLLLGGKLKPQKGIFYKDCNFKNEKERARAIMEAIGGFGDPKVYELDW